MAEKYADRKNALIIRDVNHSYGEGENSKQVLFDNSLVMKEGEVVVLMGPSGSGKTTLLTLIGALRSVQQGSIQFLGREIAGLGPKEQVKMRRDIGFIFQAHNLFDALTAQQNIKMALELGGHSKSQQNVMANEMLTTLGLGERIHYKPGNLSGGQRQRVAIGRALVNRPKMVLADEPTAALDKDTGSQVLGMLRDLAVQDGSTIIIVSHDARVINSADRIINMVDGRIVSDVRLKETTQICHWLKACPLFEKMSVSDLTDVAQKLIEEDFEDGDEVFYEGEIGEKFYIIQEGSVDVLVSTKGKPEKVAVLNEGQFFGEVALLEEKPRNATIRARGKVTLLGLYKGDFLEAVENHQSFERQLFGAISAR